jgi:hypothetical protein
MVKTTCTLLLLGRLQSTVLYSTTQSRPPQNEMNCWKSSLML